MRIWKFIFNITKMYEALTQRQLGRPQLPTMTLRSTLLRKRTHPRGAGWKKIRDLNGETKESFYTKLLFPKPTLKHKLGLKVWFQRTYYVTQAARIKRKPRPPPTKSLMTGVAVSNLKSKICHK